jgi:peptide deformylase
MVHPIVKYGDPVLEHEAAAVAEFDTPEMQALIADMFDSLYAAKGVGLAAPQIGVSKKIAVIDTTIGDEPGLKLVLINPEVIKTEGKQVGEEGCLSIPGFREQVRRPKRVTIRAWDEHGKEYEHEGEDLLARAFMHEIDHLNGRLYITHISALKRDLIKRKIKKLQRAGDWD